MIEILKRILKIKFKFFIPSKKKILVFDNTAIEVLKKIIFKENEIIYSRNEEINLFYVFITLINFSFYKEFFKKKSFYYYVSIINFHKPHKVITFIDNNILFYRLKKVFPNIKFIAIQNGYRFYKDDFFEALDSTNEKFSCDEYYCFGNETKKLLSKKLINTNIYTIGSLRNNLSTRIKKKKQECCFISSYGISSLKNENKILKILSKFCFEKNLTLSILARTNKKDEKLFYEKILNNFKYLFISKNNNFSFSYNYLDGCKLVISLNGTLGYESVSRGNKTFFINVDDRSSDCKSFLKFGWPGTYKSEGLFWTSKINGKNIFNKLNMIYKLKNLVWKKKSLQYYRQILKFNPGVGSFIKKINKL
jgi:hypothetical protein